MFRMRFLKPLQSRHLSNRSRKSVRSAQELLPLLVEEADEEIAAPCRGTLHRLEAQERGSDRKRGQTPFFSDTTAAKYLTMKPELPTDLIEDRLPTDLIALIQEIQQLPEAHRVRLAPLMNRVVQNSHRRRRILQLVQEALGQLRLDMKYLVFDLEATRRERDAYRREPR
jgi:hypothetical protein